jgi:hypothetical protein
LELMLDESTPDPMPDDEETLTAIA